MKFSENNIEFEVSNFEVLQVTDNWNGTCRVMVRLTGDNVQCVHEFPDFEYENDKWESEDVTNFITEKLT